MAMPGCTAMTSPTAAPTGRNSRALCATCMRSWTWSRPTSRRLRRRPSFLISSAWSTSGSRRPCRWCAGTPWRGRRRAIRSGRTWPVRHRIHSPTTSSSTRPSISAYSAGRPGRSSVPASCTMPQICGGRTGMARTSAGPTSRGTPGPLKTSPSTATDC